MAHRRWIGYVPLPPSADGLVPEAVVDLTYRATLDRLDILRVAGSSNAARAQLRYALARPDALRTPSVGFEIEAVVGRQITAVTVPRDDPLQVPLCLDDGAESSCSAPGEPGGGPARSTPSAARR